MKKCIVRLSSKERKSLKQLAPSVTSEKGPAGMIARARILWKADVGEGSPGCPNEKIEIVNSLIIKDSKL